MRSLRPPSSAALVLAVGIALFVISVFLKTTTLAFPLGTTSSTVAVALKPGRTACQGPIDVPADGAFDRIVVQLGTYGGLGPPLKLAVRDARGRVLAVSRVPGGYPDVGKAPRHTIVFNRLLSGQGIAVCLSNRGRSRLAIYGAGDHASRQSHASVDGRAVRRDLNIEFRRPGRTYESLADAIVARAVLWRSPHPSGAVYAGLLLLLVLVAAAAVIFALMRADGLPPSD